MTAKSPSDKREAAILLHEIAAQLPNNGFDDPRRDARHLLAMAIGRDEAVLPHEVIAFDDGASLILKDFIMRRAQGEPISRMRGRREFYGLDFSINAETLDPRADSETLVDMTLDALSDHDRSSHQDLSNYQEPLHCLDMGTGSGCLILALAHGFVEQHDAKFQGTPFQGIGVDVQSGAIAMARQNAKTLGLSSRVQFIQSDWDKALDDDAQFDLIISNPPYIPSDDLTALMPEVRVYDPMLALDGGDDGLVAWRLLAPIMVKRLADGGMIAVEIGEGQEDDVEKIFASSGLWLREARRDLGGIIRCLRFSREKN